MPPISAKEANIQRSCGRSETKAPCKRSCSGHLQFQEDGRALVSEIDRRGLALVIAKNGGTQAEAEAGRVQTPGGRNIGIEGAFGMVETGAGMGHDDLH